MSFILEALRKSEHERQRQAGPAVAEVPIVRPTSRMPVALIAIGLLLAVNLAVLMYFLLRNDAPEVVREEPVVAAAAPEATARPAPVVRTVQPPPAPAVSAPPSREVRPLTDVAATGPETAPMRDAPEAPDPMLLPPSPTVTYAEPPPVATPGAGSDVPPRLDTLPAQATAGLPPLNLDLHIYAGDPAQRAAFINGRRYREGDTLAEGVEVRAITPEGAVLQYRGQRFLLPRQ